MLLVSSQSDVGVYNKVGQSFGPTYNDSRVVDSNDRYIVGIRFSVSTPTVFTNQVQWNRVTTGTSGPWRLWDDTIDPNDDAATLMLGNVNTLDPIQYYTLQIDRTYVLSIQLTGVGNVSVSRRPLSPPQWDFYEDWAYSGNDPFNPVQHVDTYISDVSEQNGLFNQKRTPPNLNIISYLEGFIPSTSLNNKPGTVVPYQLGDFIFSYTYASKGTSTAMRPLQVYAGVSQFNLTLPEPWRVKEMKEWEIQYADSANNVDWSDWETLAVLPPQQISYAHTNVDPNRYYRYRYQVRTRAIQSQWSGYTHAGKPNVEPIPTAADVGTIAPGAVDTSELADDAVTAAKLEDGAVLPAAINQGSGVDFIFPDEVSGGQVRARTGGVFFPDGSNQTTAAVTGASVAYVNSSLTTNSNGDRAYADSVATNAQNNAISYSIQRGNHAGTQPASSIFDLTEAVQDITGAAIVAGSNVTVTYNDAAGTITVAATGGSGGPPTGTMLQWPNKSAVPTGYLEADGTSYTQAAYGALYTHAQAEVAAGNTAWTVTGTNFTVPNYKDKFLLMKGTSRAVGATGGAETVTLTTGQIPSHNHSLDVRYTFDGSHNHASAGGQAEGPNPQGGAGGAQSTGSSGGGGSHENMPPYAVVNFIIKT